MHRRFIGLLFITSIGAFPVSAAEPAAAAPQTAYKGAFWESARMTGDTLFFLAKEGEPARAGLLFTPAAPPALTNARGDISYESGRDFTWQPGTREIVLTKDSRIPSRPLAALFPAPGTANSIGARKDGSSHLLFGEGHFYHDQQITARYAHEEKWDGPAPAASPHLARTLARLKAKQPVKLVVLGDSISTGLNASGIVGSPPAQPGYPGLVADALRAQSGSEVTLKNLSVSGMNTDWGVKQIPQAIAEAPDLFILAFGMNDASGRVPPEKYAALNQQIVNAVRAARPECDIILVATSTANPEWNHAAPELYPAYRDALLKLAGPGIDVADVTSVWLAVLKRKNYHDLTGNGVNHPNDFGHRLYADVILASLREK